MSRGIVKIDAPCPIVSEDTCWDLYANVPLSRITKDSFNLFTESSLAAPLALPSGGLSRETDAYCEGVSPQIALTEDAIDICCISYTYVDRYEIFI